MTRTTTCATISNPMMDRGADDDDGDECVDDDDNLRDINPRFEVVMSDKRQDLLSGVRVLGSADAVRVEGEGGGLVGSSLSILLSVLSSVSSILPYHDASAAAIPWTNFTNDSWVPGE